MRILPECGGQTTIDKAGFLVGAPELVAEVAASSASYDLHDKLDLYRTDGVKEYLVWRTEDGEIDWFVLRRKRYVPQTPDRGGLLRSEQFPGLWLDPVALLNGDMAQVLKLVQEGIASPEHSAFVARLEKRRRR
jgi:Uma2 family endonuclease